MKIGYARVSKGEQSPDLQTDALTSAGCERIFQDTETGAREDRPGLIEALDFLRPGDALVVWKLDRLARSLRQLIELMNQLNGRGVGLQSLTENVDTTTPSGKLIFHVFGALAEFERDLIRERTRAGLEAARARGRRGGHPRVEALNSPKKLAIAQSLYADKSNSIEDICQALGVSRSTLYRYLNSHQSAAEAAAT